MKTVYDFAVKDRKGKDVRLKEYQNEVLLIVNHEFCKLTFGTDFPRFKKVKVNGDDADPLFKFLKEQKGFAGWDMEHPIAHILDDMLSKADPNYKESPDIKWNFTKFLINKRGQVVARFEPTEKIENIAAQIEKLLHE